MDKLLVALTMGLAFGELDKAQTIGVSDLFFPAHEDNIWLYRIDYNDFFGTGGWTALSIVPEGIDSDGHAYFSYDLLFPSGPYRVSENGNLWLRIDREHAFDYLLRIFDNNQSITDYLIANRETDLIPDAVLFYDFSKEDDLWPREFHEVYDETQILEIPSETLTNNLMWFIADYYLDSGSLYKYSEISDDKEWQIFEFYTPTSVEGNITFQRGVGVSEANFGCSVCSGEPTSYRLMWARVNGNEVGTHPGAGYPGYRVVSGSVTIPDSTHVSRTEVEATIRGSEVEGLTVEFARIAPGHSLHYAWRAPTDEFGRFALTISSPDPGGVSGSFRARATTKAGIEVGQWDGIRLDSDQRQILELTLGGGVEVVAHYASGPDLCANGIVVPDPWYNRGLVEDCNVLLTVKDRLAGGTRLNWSSDLLIGRWGGITARNSRLTRLDLKGFSDVSEAMTGSIPPELGQLTQLKSLDLSGNELTGPIPPELGQLRQLKWLDLSYNELTGTIPPELGKLTKLEDLFLSNNELTGAIPIELSQLTNLKAMRLGNNQLSGCVPRTLAGWVDFLPVCEIATTVEATVADDLPTVSGLDPNHPNPFNSLTQISYRLAAPGPVRLEIYNVLGQSVRTLVDESQTADFYQVYWDALDHWGSVVAAGVYLMRLHYPGGVRTRRLLHLEREEISSQLSLVSNFGDLADPTTAQ